MSRHKKFTKKKFTTKIKRKFPKKFKTISNKKKFIEEAYNTFKTKFSSIYTTRGRNKSEQKRWKNQNKKLRKKFELYVKKLLNKY